MTSRVRLKHVADVQVSNVDKKSAEGEVPVRLCNYTDVYYRDRITGDVDFMVATAPPAQVQKFRLSVGQTLITKDSETADDIGVPAYVDFEADDLICGYHLAQITPTDKVHPRYLYWFLCAERTRSELGLGASGVTRVGLRTDVIENLSVPLPPLSEQRRIAAYLDVETNRMDELVEIKARMVEAIDERDLSLAAEAITGWRRVGGERTRVVDWLPPTPTSWPWAPVSTQFDVALGRMLNAERARAGTMKPYVRNINVRWDRVDVTDLAVMDFPPGEQEFYRLKPGDLLVNEGGAGVGRAAIWEGQVEDCYFQKSVLRLRPIGRSRPRWMVEFMRVAVAQKAVLMAGNLATIPHLPAELMRSLRVPCPPTEVQDSQLRWLDSERRRTAELKDILLREVDGLQERRRSIITAAVTGEMEVA